MAVRNASTYKWGYAQAFQTQAGIVALQVVDPACTVAGSFQRGICRTHKEKHGVRKTNLPVRKVEMQLTNWTCIDNAFNYFASMQ